MVDRHREADEPHVVAREIGVFAEKTLTLVVDGHNIWVCVRSDRKLRDAVGSRQVHRSRQIDDIADGNIHVVHEGRKPLTDLRSGDDIRLIRRSSRNFLPARGERQHAENQQKLFHLNLAVDSA